MQIKYPKSEIARKIASELQKVIEEYEYTQNDFVINLEHPSGEINGDLACNVAMVGFRFLKNREKYGSPRKWAEEIVKKIAIKRSSNQAIKRFPQNSFPQNRFQRIIAEASSAGQASDQVISFDEIERVEVAGAGFINFYLTDKALVKQLSSLKQNLVLRQGSAIGMENENLVGKKIMVEFAHPNTHKQFHIGHLRNIILGESLVRILEANGAEVVRANYQGDVGLHIAKVLWALLSNFERVEEYRNKDLTEKMELLGKAYVEGSNAYKENEEAKVRILEINKRIYDKQKELVNKLYQGTRQWSLDYFDFVYKRVYSRFDRLYFEGEVAEEGKKNVLAALEKGIFEKSEGAVIFPGEKYGLHNRVFITSEGNPTYEGKDMGLAPLQFKEYDPDLIIHNVGSEQIEYFKVLFKALEIVFPEMKDREFHLAYGLVHLKEGKMSSRTGNIITGMWLLDEAKARIKKAFPDLDSERAEKLATTAVKYSFLKVNPSSEINFDFGQSISLEGNSGAYVNYTYARGKSVLNKVKGDSGGILRYAQDDVELTREERSVLAWIYRYPEVVAEAGESYSPNLIAGYVYELCQRFNSFYNKEKIIGDERENFRLELVAVVSEVIKKAMNLLGIELVEKM